MSDTGFNKALIGAIAVHAIVVAVVVFKFDVTTVIPHYKPAAVAKQEIDKPKEPEIIKSSLVNNKDVEQEIARIKHQEEEQQEKQRQLALKAKQAEQKRQQEEQRLKDLQEQLQQKKQAQKEEQQRLAKLQKERDEREKKLKELQLQQDKIAADNAKAKKQAELEEKRALEAKKKAELAKKQAEVAEREKQEALLRQKLAEEQQQQVESEVAKYAALITNKISQSWLKPVNSPQGLSCVVAVKLLPTGEVIEAQIVRSSGNTAFDRSTEIAVRKASPLPMPASAQALEKFRNFTFTFKPEESA